MIIYKITNQINNKVYIGQTLLTPEQRFQKHIQKAKRKTNRYLYDAMNLYGYNNFNIEIIDNCIDRNEMNTKEMFWISFYNSNNKNYGYNMTPGGGGGRMTPEIYEKIAAKHRGVPLSEEHKKKISNANKGRIISEEHKLVISKAQTGKILSEEHKQKLHEIHKGCPFFAGKHHTDATKQILSLKATGVKKHSKEEKEKRKKRWLSVQNPNYKEVDKNLLLQYIKEGLNNFEIAKKFTCSPPTIIEKIKKYFGMLPDDFRNSINIIGNRKKEYKPIDFHQLENIIKDGINRRKIAKYMNISEVQLATKIKNKYGYGFTRLRKELLNVKN